MQLTAKTLYRVRSSVRENIKFMDKKRIIYTEMSQAILFIIYKYKIVACRWHRQGLRTDSSYYPA